MKDKQPKQITRQSENFSKWYNEVVYRADLVDKTPVKGCLVIKPYGFGIWENIQKRLGEMIEKSGAQNAYFPIFVPQSLLKKEKDHMEGFSPELAVVTIAGGQKLKEPLIIRPTSEAIMYPIIKNWISSWRDLPLRLNQWVNAVRWEKRTYPFLRTTEFLWQEGHTVHASLKGAQKEAKRALLMYRDFYRRFLAIEPIIGVKSRQEKFAGAKNTYTAEVMTKNGKAIQAATTHNLGQNFAKVYNIRFQNKSKKRQFAWQTSWGLSTRAIGTLITAHGDEKGLLLPPKIAPIQIIIIPIFRENNHRDIIDYAQKIFKNLNSFRVKVDQRQNVSPGWKFNEWEIKGVPLRIEVGSQEIDQETITIARRDQPGKKTTISRQKLKEKVKKTLESIQKNLYQKHQEMTVKGIVKANNMKELEKAIKEKKFVAAFWCENPACEEKIRQSTQASNRCLPLRAKKENGACVVCTQVSSQRWIFAKGY